MFDAGWNSTRIIVWGVHYNSFVTIKLVIIMNMISIKQLQ